MTSSVLSPFSSKVTVVTGPPSPPSSLVHTRREYGVTSMYLPKDARMDNVRLRIQVDFGVGDVIVPGPRMIQYPVFLGGDTIELLAYPVETSIAEKLQAMVALGDANSRMKDSGYPHGPKRPDAHTIAVLHPVLRSKAIRVPAARPEPNQVGAREPQLRKCPHSCW
jgi:hypothetical protein